MRKYEELELKIKIMACDEVLTLSLENVGPDASDDFVGDFEW